MNEHETERVAATEAPAAAPAKEKKDRFLPVSILVAAALIAGALMFTSFYGGGSGGSGGSGAAPAGTNPGAAAVLATSTVTTLGARDAILGNQNAPVTLIEYGDYQCPFCGEFFQQTEPSIVSSYVNTGKVRMVFRNFAFLGAESTAAAEAAECAEDQNKLWPYHDALYSAKMADDAKGGSENDGFFTRALFIQLARGAGLDVAAFTSCIDIGKYATHEANERTAATAECINSTPTFFVNGTQILGAQPYAAFQAAIDSALK